MSRTRPTPSNLTATALVLTSFAVLSACAAASTSTVTPPAAATAVSTAPTASATPVSTVPAGGPPATTAGGQTAATTRCTTGDLAVTMEGAADSDQQTTLHLWFRDTSSSPCTLYGFPGVELRTATGQTWDLVRSSQVPKTSVLLTPGGQAHALITYLPADPSDTSPFTPATVVVTPPDERTQLSIIWLGGPITYQDGATHPGTYISAIAPGA
jgi:hypothetical protein